MSAEDYLKEFLSKRYFDTGKHGALIPKEVEIVMESFAKQEVKKAEDIINRLKYGMKTNGCSDDYINLVIKTPVHIQKKVKANIEKTLKP